MPRISANDDTDDPAQVRSQQVIDGLREHVETLIAQHREGKLFRNIVMVVDGVDPDGEPDFGVMSAEDSHLTTVVGMLALAQVVSSTQGLKIDEVEEVVVKPKQPRLM